MRIKSKRGVLVLSSLLITFVTLRVYLHLLPNSNFTVGPYNIHHLFTGVLLIAVGGLPLILIDGTSRWLDVAAVAFGAGLGMALDEWVYLIVTDGSDASYLLPESLWGGIIMISLTAAYALVLIRISRRRD